jgi:hypothetical protein
VNRGIAFAVLTTALVVGLLVGGFAYVAGLNAGGVVAATGTVPTTVVYPVWHGFGFFWPFFGFLFFFLLIGLLVRVFGGWGRGGGGGPRGGWGWGGPGGWDRSRWEQGDVPPPVDNALQNWHRRAHGDEPTPPASR